MKIAYVYDAVYPWETGGVQKRVWELSRRLADDHDVHWYGLHYWDGPSVVEREGVTLHGVDAPSEFYVDGRRSITEALRFSARLFRPLLREEFDVVDFQEFPYFPVFPTKAQSLVHDSTLLVTWHEVWGDYWYDYLGRKGVFGKAVERLTASLPDGHISVSERTQSDLETLGVTGSRLVPNGIDTAEIEQVDEADRDVDILFVGRLIKEKNPALVVEAVDELRSADPDVQATLIGEGPERERLERLVESRGLQSNVDLRGRLDSYEDVLGLMKTANVFVLPSRREGFGITVLESLAAGTPIVTLDHPQNAAMGLVDHGETGAIVDGSVSGVVGGIRVARREASASACVRSAARYEWDRLADETAALYREVA